MLGFVFDALVILTMILLVFGPATRSLVDPNTAALALVGLVALMGLGRRVRGHLPRLVLRVVLPLASLAYFVMMNGQGAAASLLVELAVVFLVLFGIYIMFRGAVPRL